MLAECACFDGENPEQAEACDLVAAEAGASGDGVKERGTACHLAHALYIQEAPAWDAGLSPWEAANVRYVGDTVLRLAAERGVPRDCIELEQRVTIYGRDFRELTWGTRDVRIGSLTIDAKYGLRRNYFPQLSAYGLADMQANGADKWEVGVIYGVGRSYEVQPVTRQTCETVTWGILARRANPHRRPTPCSYCGWCQHRLTCEAFTAPAASLVPVADGWASWLSRISSAPANVRLGLLRHVVKQYLEPFAARVENEQFNAPGVTPLGFKRSERAGRPSIANAAEATKALVSTLGVSPANLLVSVSSWSIAELLNAYLKQYPSAEYAAAKQEVISALGDNYSPGRPSVTYLQEKDAHQQITAALKGLEENQPTHSAK